MKEFAVSAAKSLTSIQKGEFMKVQCRPVATVLLLLTVVACGGGGNGGGNGNNNTEPLACTLLATGTTFTPSFNDGFIYQIGIDASNVYWFDVDSSGNAEAIKSVPKAGGSVTTLARGLGGINAFAMDGTSIYWTEHDLSTGHGSIKSVAKSGGTPTVLASGTPAGSSYDVFDPSGIALDGTYVYWGEGVGGGAVRRVPKAGGNVVDINRGQGDVGVLALDSPTSPTTIYYDNCTSNCSMGTSSTTTGYYSIPLAGGTPFTIANITAAYNPYGFITDGTSLFDSNHLNPGSVYSILLAGGTPMTLVSNLQNPGSLATDGTYIFFTGAGGIEKVAKTGGPISNEGQCTAAGAVYNTATVAVDASNVYLVGYTGGGPGAAPIAILRAPKP